MPMICDYVDPNGIFRTSHTGEPEHQVDTMIGKRTPSSPQYTGGQVPSVDRWSHAREHARLPTEPMDDPPTVN